jgi:hypothetical protein
MMVLQKLLTATKLLVLQQQIVAQTLTRHVYGHLENSRSRTVPQLVVAVLLKQPKVHTKVMNVPTVVHVMEKVVYAHVTKVTPANHAKHKQFWFKFAIQSKKK